MNLTVVAVTYNASHCIGDCVRSAREHLPGAEIVVVDNGSTDETLDIVASVSPEIRVVPSGGNVGFGRANNIGAEAASREHVLFVNPDVTVTSLDRDRLEELFASPRFGLVGPLIEDGGHSHGAIPEAHWLRDYLDQSVAPLRPREWDAHPRPAKPGDAAWVTGGFLLARRSEFLDLGAFDRRFFLYYEDRDVAARYRRAGFPIRSSSALTGQHAGSASFDGGPLRIEPIAWAFLGWLQYMTIWHGHERARRAAALGLSTMRTLERGLRAAASLPRAPARLDRKARQLAGVLEFLEEDGMARRDLPDQEPFFPDGRALVRRTGAAGSDARAAAAR